MKKKHNPSADLGCEVNYCTAKHCNEVRMSFCALRQAYLERVEKHLALYRTAKSKKVRRMIADKLAKLGVECPAAKKETSE